LMKRRKVNWVRKSEETKKGLKAKSKK